MFRRAPYAVANLTASCGASRFSWECVLITRACASCEYMLCSVPRGTLRGRRGKHCKSRREEKREQAREPGE
jgi:hypothetical protein